MSTLGNLFSFGVIGAVVYGIVHASTTATPAVDPALSNNQLWLASTIAKYQDSYSAAKSNRNDLQQNNLASERNRKLCEVTANLMNAQNWIGEVYDVRTSVVDYQNRNARLVLKLGSSWNTFWIHTDTNINQSDPVFNTLQYQNKGDKVEFNGQFAVNSEGCLRETSITQNGSMTDPEFAFRFSKVEKRN